MDKIIFFTTLVLFPFGQIFKFGIFNLFDIAVLLLALVTIFKKPKYPMWYTYFIYFLVSCLFSLLINYSLFSLNGLLYLVRFWSYSMIAIYIFNYLKDKNVAIYSLLAVSVASAIFGWIQYLIWPDLTILKYLGWDDHLLRIVGTFLDPTFLGLILVLGAIIALHKNHYLVFALLALSVLFTYSRSSYLALFLIFLFDFVKSKNIFRLLILNSIFLILFLLPKNIGEGTNLARVVSGNNKLINYEETIEIIKKSPAVGIGFNNLCIARQKYLDDSNIGSHSCNGSDSSILFILATTGIVGLILFLGFITKITFSQILIPSFFAVLLHSAFANSFFYPHIMFWLFALVGLGSKGNSK